MKPTIFSIYFNQMNMYSESNWLLELDRTNMLSFTPKRMINESLNTIQELYQCTASDRYFRTNRGLSHSKNIYSTISDVSKTDENTQLHKQSLGNIKTPEVRYKWGIYDSYQFEENLSLVYEKIVY